MSSPGGLGTLPVPKIESWADEEPDEREHAHFGAELTGTGCGFQTLRSGRLASLTSWQPVLQCGLSARAPLTQAHQSCRISREPVLHQAMVHLRAGRPMTTAEGLLGVLLQLAAVARVLLLSSPATCRTTSAPMTSHPCSVAFG